MRSFEDLQRDYARLTLLVGLGFNQKTRPLFVTADIDRHCSDFCVILAEEARKLGAPFVDFSYVDPRQQRAQFLYSSEEMRLHIPSYVTARAKEVIDTGGAWLTIYGRSELDVFDDVDPKYPSGMRAAGFKAREPLSTRQKQMLLPWSVIGVPTKAWARKLGISVSDLWTELFNMTGASQPDPLAYMNGVVASLRRRAAKLDALEIQELHFKSKGTDLTVGLSNQARWLGGSKQTEDGTWIVPNIPTFEVYTTPDWQTVEGHLKTTSPVVVGGTVVSGLRVDFKEGQIVSAVAQCGAEAYRKMIAHDAGASRMGEIALVGLDSPVNQSSIPCFFHTLYDEQRCDHMASGDAYVAALRCGDTATREELDRLGCNKSDTHTDVFFSDGTMHVFAKTYGGDVVTLQEGGHWTPEFA